MHASVGNDVEHTGFTCDFVDAHLHTRMNRANQDIHLVTLHQLIGVFHTFGGLGFVIYFEKLHLATTDFATRFLQSHAKAVVDGHAQLRERACVGEHQTNAQLAVLCACGQPQS